MGLLHPQPTPQSRLNGSQLLAMVHRQVHPVSDPIWGHREVPAGPRTAQKCPPELGRELDWRALGRAQGISPGVALAVPVEARRDRAEAVFALDIDPWAEDAL